MALPEKKGKESRKRKRREEERRKKAKRKDRKRPAKVYESKFFSRREILFLCLLAAFLLPSQEKTAKRGRSELKRTAKRWPFLGQFSPFRCLFLHFISLETKGRTSRTLRHEAWVQKTSDAARKAPSKSALARLLCVFLHLPRWLASLAFQNCAAEFSAPACFPAFETPNAFALLACCFSESLLVDAIFPSVLNFCNVSRSPKSSS